MRGGFPDSYLAESDQDSLALRRDFIRTYLERDVAVFGPRVPATTLDRLWTMLAHRQGTMLNGSVLARALEVSAQSVTRYIDLLADLLLVRRLPPLRANVGKRLVKSPKVYVRDSGLVHATASNHDPREASSTRRAPGGRRELGRLRHRDAGVDPFEILPPRATPYFYRTSAGAEIDLVIEHDDQQRVGRLKSSVR